MRAVELAGLILLALSVWFGALAYMAARFASIEKEEG